MKLLFVHPGGLKRVPDPLSFPFFAQEKPEKAVKKLENIIKKLEQEIEKNTKHPEKEKEKKEKISTKDAQKLIDIIETIKEKMV